MGRPTGIVAASKVRQQRTVVAQRHAGILLRAGCTTTCPAVAALPNAHRLRWHLAAQLPSPPNPWM